MADQPVQIVDDEDNVVGSGAVTEVRAKGLRHRIARVMVKDPAGRILLQKRADHMRTFPGRWDTSAAGHVDLGEDYTQAAKREMFEEIGLSAASLREIDYYRSENKYEQLDIRRFNKTFEITISPETVLKPDPAEVSETRWFTKQQLKDMVRTEPDVVTDGLEHYVRTRL